jgi:hypothetical protein
MDELAEVPDAVLSQPMSTPEEIAELVLDGATRGARELVARRLGGYLTTLGYLFPTLRRALMPVMERRGRRARERYLARAGNGGGGGGGST